LEKIKGISEWAKVNTIDPISRLVYTGWPKTSKPPPILQKNRTKDCHRD